MYRLVKLPNGSHSIHSLAHHETFHPVVGPAIEAEALYVGQLRRLARSHPDTETLVVWDVGLGAAANALTIVRAAADWAPALRLVSFDHTLDPMRFALEHRHSLPYLAGYESTAARLLDEGRVRSQFGKLRLDWELHLADFPSLIAQSGADAFPKPHLVMFDAFSPAKNPAMWTRAVFTRLFQLLDPTRPAVLPTYSRSTILRVTLLLAGFFVGVGEATGEKEETTLAANRLGLLEHPLDSRWLERARRSTSAEPLSEPIYRQAPLSAESGEQLRRHPQFA